jgi:hypothetical protein
MLLYKIQDAIVLDHVDKDRRDTFCGSFHQYLRDSTTVIHHIWSTDKAQCHLKEEVSTQNMNVWGTGNPHTVMRMSLHPQKCTKRCSILSAEIVKPIFLDDTVTAHQGIIWFCVINLNIQIFILLLSLCLI